MVHVVSQLPTFHVPAKSLRLVGVAMATVALLAGCATQKSTHAAIPGEATPAATGEVTVDRDDNNNVVVQLAVEHFPPPELLASDLSTYVVWVRPQGEDAYQNMGQLQIGDDRAAQASFVTPYDRFDLIVTAETSARETSPSDHVILQSRVSEGAVMEGSGTGGGPGDGARQNNGEESDNNPESKQDEEEFEEP